LFLNSVLDVSPAIIPKIRIIACIEQNQQNYHLFIKTLITETNNMSTHTLFAPESLMMGYAYNAAEHEGAVKSPLFQTSTFAFNTAEEGKAYFELAYARREQNPGEALGYIYSRISNPNVELFEKRLCLWDGAEEAAAFNSGMSAISTIMLEFLKPGDLLLYSNPVYGGTHHFIHHVLTNFGIEVMGFGADQTREQLEWQLVNSGLSGKLAMIFIETPANPTNSLVDIEMCAQLAKQFSVNGRKIFTVVDNTYMGPLWQHPLKHGADMVAYSATKYIGGHSDLIAGAVTGNSEWMHRIKNLRTFLGNTLTPFTAWLLLRSLETMKLRMDEQSRNTEIITSFLRRHPMVERVYIPGYPGALNPEQETVFKKQCLSRGAMLGFDIHGGEKEAFIFLNNLKLIKLAVSLGGTESLAEHPATMTHLDIPEAEKLQYGITPSLIRLSIGVEQAADLIKDIEQALKKAEENILVMNAEE
jgi:methionine-gamma-lyase